MRSFLRAVVPVLSGVAVGLLVLSCKDALGPQIGGPCEYDHAAGICRVDAVRTRPHVGDLVLADVSFRPEPEAGRPMSAVVFEETFIVHQDEVAEVKAHYQRHGRAACEGARIRKGTCSPQSFSYQAPRFSTPGAATGRDVGSHDAMVDACEKDASNPFACDQAAYVLRYGVGGVSRDRERSKRLYARALTSVIALCKDGLAEKCQELGVRLERGLGIEPDLPSAAVAFRRACTLGARASCTEAELATSAPDAGP